MEFDYKGYKVFISKTMHQNYYVKIFKGKELIDADDFMANNIVDCSKMIKNIINDNFEHSENSKW